MKKIFLIITANLIGLFGVNAQTIYEGAAISQGDLNGTARFVGMGGAMGALGGDLSTIGNNPAGMGVFRRSEASVSLGMSAWSTESNYTGTKLTSDANRFEFNQIGTVISTHVGDYTPLRYINFGFGYQRIKSFYRDMKMQGNLGATSQTYAMAAQADGLRDDEQAYPYGTMGWLTDLGYGSYLINPAGDGTFYGMYDNAQANFLSRERGGIDHLDFNMAANINDRIYLGMTIGAYWVDYSKYVFYDENYGVHPDYGHVEQYNLQSWNKLNGAGFDLKFGVIVRPMEYSPLRLGFAIHTPTFYKLDYKTNAIVQSDVVNQGEDNKLNIGELGLYEVATDNLKETFQLQTPWTFQLSAGYTVGSQVALGVEYEYKNYDGLRFKDEDGYEDTYDLENTNANDMLKGVHTFRIGGEYKVIPQFALRMGYNHSTALFKDDAYKNLPYFSPATDTDFSNKKAQNDFTIGCGYRSKSFYIDLAYKYTNYNSDFYPFAYPDNNMIVSTEATKVTNTRNQAILTLGFRF